MFWVACIIGVASVTYAFEELWIAIPVMISGFLPVARAILLLFMREKPAKPIPVLANGCILVPRG